MSSYGGGTYFIIVFHVDSILDSKSMSYFDVDRMFQISIVTKIIENISLQINHQCLITLLFLMRDSKTTLDFYFDRMFQILTVTCGLSDKETRK